MNWLLLLTCVGTMLGAALVGGYQAAFAGKVFPGVETFGVDVGGRSADEAAQALAARAAALRDAPISVVAADTSRATTWAQVGLQIDTAALVARSLAVGREGTPFQRLAEQWRALSSHEEIPASRA